MKRARLLLGISIFWLALSMLFDGLNAIVLPNHLFKLMYEANRATILGLITFFGLLIGMLIQPLAGIFSDQLRPRWGRRGTITIGVFLMLASLAFFGITRSVFTVFLSYFLIQISINIAQAAQQGFIPDFIPTNRRGIASGLKGFMDLSGALLGFVVLGQLLGEGKNSLALIAIVTIIIVTFLLTVILVNEPSTPITPKPIRITLSDTYRLDLRQHRAFVWLVVSRFLFLLGTYAVGRFFLFFIADRLALDVNEAAEQAGALLATLTLLTVLATPPAGWATDRFGRIPLMLIGALLSAFGAIFLIVANNGALILLFGGLMAVGSAAFASANWALTADYVPSSEAAHFFGLANFGTAGAAAAAGLFGPLVDWANGLEAGLGYSVLFILSGVIFTTSALALRGVRLSRKQPVLSQLQTH